MPTASPTVLRFLRWAFWTALGATGLALYWQIAWVRDICPLNPEAPDVMHPHNITLTGRYTPRLSCYVSDKDIHTYHLLIAAIFITGAMALGLGLLRQKLREQGS